MANGRMHDQELDIDASLVHGLLLDQFPHWASLPLRRLDSAGTDNAIFRLGDALSVRLPRIHWSVEQVAKEVVWLPILAPHLPLEVPVPLAKGLPGRGYPWAWSVCRWLDGENATLDHLTDPSQAALDLARFISALRALDAAAGPAPGAHNSGRGVPLAQRDRQTREALSRLDGLIDTARALAEWEAALLAPAWNGPPVWIHGDVQSGNLLARQGRLTGVIDFGCLGVGDPACDLQIAWTLFSGDSRQQFRRALAVDDASWARGRGWALSVALIALPYYLHTNPALVAISHRAIAEILAE